MLDHHLAYKVNKIFIEFFIKNILKVKLYFPYIIIMMTNPWKICILIMVRMAREKKGGKMVERKQKQGMKIVRGTLCR
jgi:hypothetical protein